MKLCIIALMLALGYPVESYRILAIFPFPGKSHVIMPQKLMIKLVEEGHTVDVVSHFPLEHQIPRYNDLSIAGSVPILTGNVTIDYIVTNWSITSNLFQVMFEEIGLQLCDKILNNSVLQNLKSSQVKYDLLITIIYGVDCFLGYKHIFNIPVVALSLGIELPWSLVRIGNPDNPSYIPNSFSAFNNEMNFYERFVNTKDVIISKWKYSKYNQIYNSAARKYFGKDLPDLQELAKQTNLVLSNSHFSTHYSRPSVPNFIEIGGLHIDSVKPLTNHFKQLLKIEPPYKGIIYFNLGTMVLSETFPKEKLQAFVETFRQLPYKILWKGKKENILREIIVSDNVYIESWMPQLDILCHDSVKLFIFHGGILGTQEAIYCGVPVLGIPFFSDQKLNIMSLKTKNMALVVDYETVSTNVILDTIWRLLKNPMYKANAKQFSLIFKDRPLSPSKTAIYWIEYVIRHKGALHLRSAAADLHWVKYYLIDIMLTITSLMLLMSIVIYYLLTCFIRFCFENRKSLVKLKSN